MSRVMVYTVLFGLMGFATASAKDAPGEIAQRTAGFASAAGLFFVFMEGLKKKES